MMSEARQNAFRRLLYAAMLDFRAHEPVHPYESPAWCTPLRWRKTMRRLQQIQLTADWLHNLAAFAAHDFAAFDEAWFWRETESLVNRFPAVASRLDHYRREFENEWDPRTGSSLKVREWGIVGEL